MNDLQDSLHNSMDTIEGSEKLVKEGMAEVKGTVDELKKAVDKSTRQVWVRGTGLNKGGTRSHVQCGCGVSRWSNCGP